MAWEGAGVGGGGGGGGSRDECWEGGGEDTSNVTC